ncbi:MAG: AMP-binding protein [Candidatus Protistobacter heckmanni]|nr:AMP-binding protein [Candidatus Protistobacter heckmanni]
MILKHGGTMYVDGGDPGAQGLDRTLESLSEVSPTVYFNLPLGYAALLPHLRRDPSLRETFFSRLQVLFSAGAPMPAETAAALRDMAEGCKRDPVQILSAWGATETSPLATDCHFEEHAEGAIGLRRGAHRTQARRGQRRAQGDPRARRLHLARLLEVAGDGPADVRRGGLLPLGRRRGAR